MPAELDQWPPEQNWAPPAISNRFQQELVTIAGRAPNKLPILRLEWGGTCKVTSHVPYLKYQYRWASRLAKWIVDERDAKGNVKRTHTYPPTKEPPPITRGIPRPVYERFEIGVPRWFVAQYIPPDLLGDWETTRKKFEMDNGVDAMGQFPRDGFYWWGFHCIAHHEDGCCLRATQRNEKCFGLYRAPGDIDLKYIRALNELNMADKWKYHWTDAPTPDAVAERVKMMESNQREQYEKDKAERREIIRDAIRTHEKRLTGEGHGPDLFKYTDLGATLKKLRENGSIPDAYAGPSANVAKPIEEKANAS